MNIAELIASIGFKADTSPLDTIDHKLEGIKGRLEFLAAAEIIRGVFELGERYSGFAEQLGVAATAAGITAESLQKLQYAAGLAGVSGEEVSTGLAHLTRTLYEARNGSQEAQAAFATVGISPAQIATFRTSTDAMAALSDKFAQINDPIKKQAITLQLLGRGGANMVEFLSQGSKAMDQAGQSAEAMGAVISSDAINSLRQMEDSMSTLWRTLKAFAGTVASYIAPSLRDFAKVMTELYARNRAVISIKIKEWVEKLLYAFGFMIGVIEAITDRVIAFADAHPKLVSAIGEAIIALIVISVTLMSVGKAIGVVKDAWELMGTAMSALKMPFKLVLGGFGLLKRAIAALLLRLAVMVSTTFPAVGEALLSLGATIEATPVGWFATAVVGLVLAFQALWAMLHGKSWKETWFGQLVEKGLSAGKSLLQTMGLIEDEEQEARKQAGLDENGQPIPMGANGVMMRYSQAMNNVQATAAAAATPRPKFSPEEIAMANSARDRVFNLNAPINISVPPGTDPQMVGDKVKQGVQEHLDRVMRQTALAMGGSQAY